MKNGPSRPCAFAPLKAAMAPGKRLVPERDVVEVAASVGWAANRTLGANFSLMRRPPPAHRDGSRRSEDSVNFESVSSQIRPTTTTSS